MYVKRDYYAEERAAAIAKLKMENDIKFKPICDSEADKVSELELELEQLKASHEKSTTEARQIKIENEKNKSKKDLEISRLQTELQVFTDRYDEQFLKRVQSVLWDDYEMFEEDKIADLVFGSLGVKPKLQAKHEIYKLFFNYAGESFDFD